MVNSKDAVVRQMSKTEGREMLDALAHRYLEMSADEFITAWDSGGFDRDPDRPEVVRLAMLLPFVREGR